MSGKTKETWAALQQIALRYFKEVHRSRPSCKASDLIEELSLPETPLIFDLLKKSGFLDDATPSIAQLSAVAGMCIRGVWSEATIAAETRIPIDTVRAIFESYKCGYGNTPYGSTPYGGSHGISKDNEPVPRRVTTAGQLRYRGKIYTLGARYRGRNAMVRERKDQLLLTFNDRSPLYLSLKSQ